MQEHVNSESENQPSPKQSGPKVLYNTRLPLFHQTQQPTTFVDNKANGFAPPPPPPPARLFASDIFASPKLALTPVESLYIHVPFCFHKCHYCDFYSIVDTRDRQKAFTDRLCNELRALSPYAGKIKTIFVGGGTPSLLRVDLWHDLLACLSDAFDLSEIHANKALAPAQRDTEFTVECNPETVTTELFDTLNAGGVDRISLGAQSFHPQHLKTLERWHDPANVGKAVQMARAEGFARVSIDLIFAIPGQTVDEWRADLLTALALGTDHVSCYNLTYEANTAMTARLKKGEFEPIDEDTEIAMYLATWQALRGAGMRRYEVSNYAFAGQESRHNLAYWRQSQWLAAGPSASAHVAGVRWKNLPRLDDYLDIQRDGTSAVIDAEWPDATRALRERIMTGLRLAEGLDSERLTAQAEGVCPGSAQRLESRIALHAQQGNVVPEGGNRAENKLRRWVLTDSGVLMADAIAANLMDALRQGPIRKT